MAYYIAPPPQGPLARLVTGIIAALALVGAVMFGLVAFLVITALAAVAGIAIWLRVWWLKRRLEKEGFKPHEMQDPELKGHVIDAEYTVVEEPRDPPDS
ncbi:MAG: hypothetical protein PVJ71_07085 [Lysobacterales bacterium]|jgi:membrane protein implicated in regulation of membrane protease activity